MLRSLHAVRCIEAKSFSCVLMNSKRQEKMFCETGDQAVLEYVMLEIRTNANTAQCVASLCRPPSGHYAGRMEISLDIFN